MSDDKITTQILDGSQKGLKTYAFDEEHDDNLPAQWWFQLSIEGLVLFLVYYTQACRWSRCLACNLPSKCSKFHVDFQALIKQTDFIFRLAKVEEVKKKIRKVIISNNGSILDEATFSSTALIYLMSQINTHLPNVRTVCLETRPEYVDHDELEFLKRTLSEGVTPTELELAIGFEVFDDYLRNNVLQKGLSLDVLEKVVAMMAPYKYHLKCYLMQKPLPGMTNQQAVEDIWQAIDYLSRLINKYKIAINIHLNPTYVAYGTELEKAFLQGEFSPPILPDVIKAVKYAQGKGLSIFIGLYDEGLAVPGGSVIRPNDEPLVKALETFNRRQDFTLLP